MPSVRFGTTVNCPHTTWATWLDNDPIHTGHPTSAEGVIVSVWHGSAEGVLYPYGTGPPTPHCTIPHRSAGQPCNIVHIWHGLAGAILYLYCTGWPRTMTHDSPYHIYHLPIWVMHLNTFDMELTIYVRGSFFNVNSTVMFVSWSDYLIWQLFRECWYRAYHICPGLIFQCEFNGDVCFVIGLPDLAIISGMLI